MAIFALGVLLAAFILGLVLGSPYIALLRRLKMGKQIRREGPQSHLAKQGTPTLGGVLVIAVVVLLWLVVFAFLSFAFIAAARGFPWLVVLCAAIVGALLAYLWFNVHRAEFIMGDVGSLSLGAVLATVALTTGFILLLPVAGVIYVLENVSVILQVGSFKLRGKRIFRMAPIHHHFELIGWPEQKVTIRFWLIGALAGITAAILAFATPVK